MSDDLVVIDGNAPSSMALVDGQIALGGAQVHPVIARELWLRLGAVLGQAAKDAEQPLWDGLARALDHQFRGAYPCRGRMDGTTIDGMLLRESDERACFRLSMFSIAMLKKQKRGWEGLAFEVRPLMIGRELRPLGFAVHVAEKAVRALPRALPGPTVALQLRPAAPPSAPSAPAWLLERRAALQAQQAQVLDAIGPVGAVATLDAIAAIVPLQRDVLREHLETLVDVGELLVSDGHWTRLGPRERRQRRVEKLPKGQRTRLARAPKAPVKAKPKPVKPEPTIVKLRCASCRCSGWGGGPALQGVPGAAHAEARLSYFGAIWTVPVPMESLVD